MNISRRQALKAGAVTTGAVWAAPAITSIATASADTSAPPCDSAAPCDVRGQAGAWEYFEWSGPGEVVGPFVVAGGPGVFLDVTDAFVSGDMLEVRIDGSAIGTTSCVPDDKELFESSADLAYCDPEFSSGSFPLPAGPNSVEFVVVQTAVCCADGAAYYRVRQI